MSYKAYNHGIILYPNCQDHIKAQAKIERDYEFAKILHNKDTDENGVLKKEHWHYVLKFKSQVWATAIAVNIGVDVNLLYKINSLKGGLKYLIHKGQEDKWQYSAEEVSGTLLEDFKASIEDKASTEGAQITAILDYIDTQEYIYYADFARTCANNGWWATYRRSGAIINGIIKEHNSIFGIILKNA